MGRRWAAPAGLAIGVFLYQALLYAWRRLPMVDEGVVWLFADEILRGRLPYRDFHCEYTPLAFYLHAAYAAVFGPSILRARVLLYAPLAAAGAVAAYAAARTFAGRGAATAIAAAVFVGTFPYHAYASYNTMATVLALATAAAVLHAARGERPYRWAVAGLLAALTFATKQNIGGLVGIGAGAAAIAECVRRGRRGPFLAYAAAALGTLAAGAIAVAATGVWTEFVDQALIWPSARVGLLPAPYPTDQAARFHDLLRAPSLTTYDSFTHSASFLTVFLPPLVLIPLALRAVRAARPEAPSLLALIPLASCAAFGAWHEPTTWHIAFARPLPVLAAGAALVEASRPGRRAAALAALLGAAFLATHIGRQALIFDGHTAEIHAPRAAGIRVRPWEARWIDDVLDVIDHIPKGETYWIAWVDLLYYHLVDDPLPVHTTFIEPDVAMMTGQDHLLIEDLERNDVRWVLHPRGRNEWYDMGRLPALRHYLEETFRRVREETIANGAGRVTVYHRRGLPHAP